VGERPTIGQIRTCHRPNLQGDASAVSLVPSSQLLFVAMTSCRAVGRAAARGARQIRVLKRSKDAPSGRADSSKQTRWRRPASPSLPVPLRFGIVRIGGDFFRIGRRVVCGEVRKNLDRSV